MTALRFAGNSLASFFGGVWTVFKAIDRALHGPPNQPADVRFIWGIARFVCYWGLYPVLLVAIIAFGGAALGFWKAEPRTRTASDCVSQLTGSVWQMESAVKQTLRDPASFEHIESGGTTPDASGNISVRMSYRARNGFGGMNVETAYALVGRNCSVTLTDGPPALARVAKAQPAANASHVAAFNAALASSRDATADQGKALKCSGKEYVAAKAAFQTLFAAYVNINTFDDPTDALMASYYANNMDLGAAYLTAGCHADAEARFREVDPLRSIPSIQARMFVDQADRGLRLLKVKSRGR